MAIWTDATQGKTRDLPVTDELKHLLLGAADAVGVDEVRVISGGQCRKGTCAKRTGSTRHDDGQAADLQLIVAGHRQNFTGATGLEVFSKFATACAAGGATGIGAGIGYMGPETIHVGFGSKAIWGAGGKAANAPDWLIDAVREGWRGNRFSDDLSEELGLRVFLDSDDDELEEDQLQAGQ